MSQMTVSNRIKRNHTVTREEIWKLPPDWEKAIEPMSLEGASSSDAMILNMYYSSKFNAILSIDFDVGFSVLNRKDKVCTLPDDLINP